MNKLPGVIFIIIILIIGIFIYEDYGLSWDEEAQREIGYKTYNYLVHGDKSLYEFINNDYGIAFELPLIFLEKIFKLRTEKEIYLVRHLVTHLFFVFSLWFLYLTGKFLFKSNLTALIVLALVVLHPRIYAHSFFNSKDIPFLSMFIIAFYVLVKSFSAKSVGKFILLGIVCGLLVNIRIMGIIILPVVIALLGIDLFFDLKNKINGLKNLIYLGTFILTFLLTLIGSWPYLWPNPIDHFLVAFNNMSAFRWDRTILFLGEQIKATQIPWFYFPVWFVFTTPLLFLIAGLSGIVIFVMEFIKRPVRFLSNNPERNYLIYFVCFMGPISAVFIFKSVLYDGWRQMFFVYPSFALLAGLAFTYLVTNYQKIKKPIIILFGIYFLYITVNNILIHPFQNVYFNELITGKKKPLREYMELDYWGVTYKQALNYIVQNDNRENIYVHYTNFPGHFNYKVLPEKEKLRIKESSSIEKADYFITNYRWHPGEYEFKNAEPVYEIKYKNSEIIKVWKFRRD